LVSLIQWNGVRMRMQTGSAGRFDKDLFRLFLIAAGTLQQQRISLEGAVSQQLAFNNGRCGALEVVRARAIKDDGELRAVFVADRKAQRDLFGPPVLAAV